MKKYFSLIMSMLMIVSICSSSIAQNEFDENFSIRKDIYYHMPKEEVQQTEKSPLATVSDSNIADADTLAFRGGHSSDKWSDYLYYKGVTLAGYKDTYMSYGFDDNGLLVDVTYIFNTGDQQKIYTEMRSNLSSKYDSPVFDENAPFPSESYRVASKDQNIGSVTVEFAVTKYTGWLVKYADCYVEIDLCLHRIKVGTNSNNYTCSIGYRLVSFEEFDELKELIQQYTQTVQNSIENDL